MCRRVLFCFNAAGSTQLVYYSGTEMYKARAAPPLPTTASCSHHTQTPLWHRQPRTVPCAPTCRRRRTASVSPSTRSSPRCPADGRGVCHRHRHPCRRRRRRHRTRASTVAIRRRVSRPRRNGGERVPAPARAQDAEPPRSSDTRGPSRKATIPSRTPRTRSCRRSCRGRAACDRRADATQTDWT